MHNQVSKKPLLNNRNRDPTFLPPLSITCYSRTKRRITTINKRCDNSLILLKGRKKGGNEVNLNQNKAQVGPREAREKGLCERQNERSINKTDTWGRTNDPFFHLTLNHSFLHLYLPYSLTHPLCSVLDYVL